MLTREQWLERLERRGEELERHPERHALYKAFAESGKSILEIWTPTGIERGRPQ